MSEPVYTVQIAVELKAAQDRLLLRAALERQDDEEGGPRVAERCDPESGQVIVEGTGEDELNTVINKLARDLNLSLQVGVLQAAYRETLSCPATTKFCHMKLIGGAGEFAEVEINFKPLPPGSGFVFENDVVGGTVPKAFIPAIESGLRTQKEHGLIAGFPVIDFQATLVDGKCHQTDSNAEAFYIAARAAFRELATSGGVVLLEPTMRVEIVTPEDYLAPVIGDLLARDIIIQGTESAGELVAVVAQVPVSLTLGYRKTLHAITHGRGQCTVSFDRYDRVPGYSGDNNDPPHSAAAALRVA